MAKKNREPRDRQMELARRADSDRRSAEDAPEGMSFSQAQTPIRYLAARLMERRDRREFEEDQPRNRARAAESERQMTDGLSRYAEGGMVRGCKAGQTSGKGFSGNY